MHHSEPHVVSKGLGDMNLEELIKNCIEQAALTTDFEEFDKIVRSLMIAAHTNGFRQGVKMAKKVVFGK